MISVWMELDETVRYMLGFIELNERELHETIGKQYGKGHTYMHFVQLTKYG